MVDPVPARAPQVRVSLLRPSCRIWINLMPVLARPQSEISPVDGNIAGDASDTEVGAFVLSRHGDPAAHLLGTLVAPWSRGSPPCAAGATACVSLPARATFSAGAIRLPSASTADPTLSGSDQATDLRDRELSRNALFAARGGYRRRHNPVQLITAPHAPPVEFAAWLATAGAADRSYS
jgi:hypothetical protein